MNTTSFNLAYIDKVLNISEDGNRFYFEPTNSFKDLLRKYIETFGYDSYAIINPTVFYKIKEKYLEIIFLDRNNYCRPRKIVVNNDDFLTANREMKFYKKLKEECKYFIEKDKTSLERMKILNNIYDLMKDNKKGE